MRRPHTAHVFAGGSMPGRRYGDISIWTPALLHDRSGSFGLSRDMAEIVVVGAGITGLTSAMLLARDGHHVTVLERDPAPPPVDPAHAWAEWQRRGVNQF